MVKKIKFSISAEGEVSLSVEGAEGTSCEALTKPFEQMLGTVSQRQYKDSYFSEATEQVNQSHSQGES